MTSSNIPPSPPSGPSPFTPPSSSPSPATPPAEKLPEYPGWWRLLTTVNPTGPRWPGALRAALAVVVPSTVALILGHESEMLLIAAGGFAVIYGEGLPFRTRWRVMALAALFLAAGSTAGACVGSVLWPRIDAGGTHWWLLLTVLFTTGMAVVAGFVQNALRLSPPGGFFIVMASGGATMVARQGLNPVEVGLWAGIGGASAVVIGMVPALWGRRRPETTAVENLERLVAGYAAGGVPTVEETHKVRSALASVWRTLVDAGVVRGGENAGSVRDDLARRALAAQVLVAQHSHPAGPHPATTPVDGVIEETTDSSAAVDINRLTVPLARPSISYRLHRSVTGYSHATLTALKILVAGLGAGTVSVILGFDRPDWAIISAMLVLQWGPDRKQGTVRGLHRLIGSVIGIGLFAIFHMLGLESWGMLAALACCQFLAEVFVVKNYAIAVIVTTPLALMMGGSMHLPVGEVVFSRVAEVMIAVIFAIGGLWFFFLRDAEIRHSRLLAGRSFSAMGALLGKLLISQNPQEATVERRDLQYELIGERRAAQLLAYSAPEYARVNWPRHLEIQRAGYSLLNFCTTVGNREVSLPEINHLARNIRDVRSAVPGPQSLTSSPRGGIKEKTSRWKP